MSDDRLIHYSEIPLVKVYSVEQLHDASRDPYPMFKPKGLWVSVGDGEDSWRAWCEGESWGVARLVHKAQITLAPDARILRLNTVQSIDEFTEQFAISPHPVLASPRGYCIDWPRVATLHQGIIIAPYQYTRRLHSRTAWYYGWDCASGCVWDANAVASLSPL